MTFVQTAMPAHAQSAPMSGSLTSPGGLAARGGGLMMRDNMEKQLEMNTRLFLAYLKHQTPDDKVDAQQMMNTMLSMLSAAQHINTNKILSDSYALAQQAQQMSLTHYLGKYVECPASVISNTRQAQEVHLVLPPDAVKADITVFNPRTREIAGQYQAENLEGSNGEPVSFTWQDAPSHEKGLYQLVVQAADAQGRHLPGAQVMARHQITAVSFDQQGRAQLHAGDHCLDPLSVHRVFQGADES